jgi:hypothetical protein
MKKLFENNEEAMEREFGGSSSISGRPYYPYVCTNIRVMKLMKLPRAQ